jgi:hypothetical protein
MADADDEPKRRAAYGRIWPKLLLSGLVGLTVAGGIVLKLLG